MIDPTAEPASFCLGGLRRHAFGDRSTRPSQSRKESQSRAWSFARRVFGRRAERQLMRSQAFGRFVIAALMLASTMGFSGQAHTAPESRAQEIIRTLGLKPLPKEAGYLGLIGSSAQMVPVNGRQIAIQSQVYYMLTRDSSINYLHWLAPDDTHILIEGGPVDYFIFHPDGHVEKIVLGRDFAHGERAVVAVPGGCWKALRLHEGTDFALMANALSPEFTPDRVRIGEGAAWVKRFSGKAPWATEDELKRLIGPNWIP